MASGWCGKSKTLMWELKSDGTLTISGTGAMDNCNHKKPKAPWDNYKNSIKKVVINYGVESIGNYAFFRFENLSSVTIPDSVKSIGEWAFSDCKKLTRITIPDSVTYIGDSAFDKCSSLTSVIIPDSVIIIGDSAFNWCKRLTSVTIPDSVTTIGEAAFSYCESLTSVTIPDSVMTIGDEAFKGCFRLTSVTISDSVTFISKGAFFDCDSLISVTIPDSVTYIDDAAFLGCKNLISVTIPDSVTYISKSAFFLCDNLKEIYYPEGRDFEKILGEGNNAKLIPYTPAPKAAQIKTSPKPVVQTVAEPLRWTFAVKTLTIGGVREIKDYSREDPPWRDKVNKIQKIVFEDGVEKIAANAFIDCKCLEQVIIPASVKTIGDLAFTVCYCGERMINNCRNVIWNLDNGVLRIKKNPDAKSNADFSTGYAKWQVAEKNIVSVKIERGVVPGKQFFDWMAKMGNNLQVSFE